MSHKLSEGAWKIIMQGGTVDEPIMQVLESKQIASNSSEKERIRFLVSDGKYFSFAMLTIQDTIKDMASGDIAKNTIIKIKRYITSKINNTGNKRIMIILDMEILEQGDKVGNRIGNPIKLSETDIGDDGFSLNLPAPKTPMLSNMSSVNTTLNEQNKRDIKAEVANKSALCSRLNFDLMVPLTSFKEAVDKYYHLVQQLETESHADCLNKLNLQILKSTMETEKNKKEILNLGDKLKAKLEEEERYKNVFLKATERILSLTEQNKMLITQQNDKLMENKNLFAEKERCLQEIEVLNQRVNQLQRQLGLQQGNKPSTSSEKLAIEPPTVNIKPMAGHSTIMQIQTVPMQPLASNRSRSVQLSAITVLLPSIVMVPSQQQDHTNGGSSIELSSGLTTCHTNYVPATSLAMLVPQQVTVPTTQSNPDNEDEENYVQVQALVLPHVEPPSPAQEQGTSSCSSDTVTEMQAGRKRPREADAEGQHEATQVKQTRVLQGSSNEVEESVDESELEIACQVVVVASDEIGPDEGEGESYNMPYEDSDAQNSAQDNKAGIKVEMIADSSEVPNQSELAESDMPGVVKEECEAVEEGEEIMQPEATSSGTNV